MSEAATQVLMVEHASTKSLGDVMPPWFEISPPLKSVFKQTPKTSPFAVVMIESGAAPFAQGPLPAGLVVVGPELVVELPV